MKRGILRLSPLGSRTAFLRRASDGEQPYKEPGGWLFGEKPLKPGEKRVREDWETAWHWGWGLFFFLGYMGNRYKPDTSLSTWAYHEAKMRMEARGEVWDYERTPISGEFFPNNRVPGENK
ncbi:hypothetical protein DSO57_1004184 [Entomophthora muscae]|uniref:Uncharacterized protein n=1 Tax=Entomophthora muscae TaxID=34485 RepID=A0ACC2UTM2_9FUNG|nr:hypothetical protein DSO57_1004184 [Entomophthora muscae]